MTDVYITETNQGIAKAVDDMFTSLEKTGPILKKTKEVYIKVNGIDFKKHCYTSPAVLEEVIKRLWKIGATKISVMENATQANMTRVVFAINGFKDVIKRTGAIPVYLDEEKTKTFQFKGKPSASIDEKGYILKEFRLPSTVVKLIENKDSYTYISLPKLKTHSMAGVTLGIKNQWGFPQHADRGKDHNYNLHSKIVDVFEYIRPDITIIDGIEGTIHGHYPPTALEDRLVKKFDILIGGRDTLAVDVVGARVFGLALDEIEHLKIAYTRGLGEGDLARINVIGKDVSQYKEKFPTDLLQEFPADVKIVRGNAMLCREGCQNNPLAMLQVLFLDHGGKGGFFIVMGKGFDKDLAMQLKQAGYSRGLVVGGCAVKEVGETLRQAFGKKNVFFSEDCNNLAQTATGMFKLAKVHPLELVPIPIHKLALLFVSAKLHGSKALTPALF